MKALSIRQPYAEMILRGEKTIEYRSRPTTRIGERFFIYASKGNGQLAIGNGVGRPIAHSPLPIAPDSLPRGVIVGTAIISHVTVGTQAGRLCHQWHLVNVKRAKRLRKPRRQPQPVWFRPF